MKKDSPKQLLVETHRPHTLEGYVFQDKETEKLVRGWIKAGAFPHVLLTGGPGCGKSTLARILINELNIEPADVKNINASLKNGIGFIRDELEPWMRKTGFGTFKVVLFEEADQLTLQGQKSLRALIEDYSDTVRFIMTANYPKQIIDPLISRFLNGHISMQHINEDGILDLVCDIIEKEGIVVDDVAVVMEHVRMYAPDIRKIINSIDKSTGDDMTLGAPTSLTSGGADIGAWTEYVNSTSTITLAKALPLTEAIDQSNFETFYEVLYDNSSKFPDEGNAVVLLSQYLDRALRVANQRLHIDALLYHIFMETD